MTGTNHVFTGALVAVTIQRPLLAIPVAFFSHFLVDMLPHYGYGSLPVEMRDKQKHFMTIQMSDAYVALALYLTMPYLLRNYQSPLVTAVCMLAAQAPDVFWAFEYLEAQRTGKYHPRNWYARLHKAIQWCERPWGAFVEIIWFGLVAIGIKLAVR